MNAHALLGRWCVWFLFRKILQKIKIEIEIKSCFVKISYHVISYHIETGDCSIYYPLAIGYFVGSKIVLLVY